MVDTIKNEGVLPVSTFVTNCQIFNADKIIVILEYCKIKKVHYVKVLVQRKIIPLDTSKVMNKKSQNAGSEAN